MMFDKNAYLDAYCKVRFECWYEYLESDISLKDASFPSLVYSALKNVCAERNEEAVTRIRIDGVALEKTFNRKTIFTQIADFLVDNDNVEITYFIDYSEFDDADKLLHTIAENKDKYMSLLYDITEDDYIVLINFDTRNGLEYIKVYSDGTCKHIKYAEWMEPVCRVKSVTLDTKLFNKLLSHTKSKVKARKKPSALLQGEYLPRMNESYYQYGFREFGQFANDYWYEEEKHYFEYKTKVKVIDELIEMIAPDKLEPLILGFPAHPHKFWFRGQLPGDYDPDEYDEDEIWDEFDDDDDLDSLFTKLPTPDGKDKCEKLREIRMKFAKDNNIDYEFKECTHEGPCAGTCPLCDKEVKDLAEIAKKRGIKFSEEE